MEKNVEQTDIEARISDILTRGVGTFVDPDGTFKRKLIAKTKGEYKKDIIVKFGVDPTRPDIHLGHAVVLRKLRQLQDLGCKIVFLIGDITAQIGDPTGKSKVRPEIDFKAIEENVKTYLDQVDKILLVERDKNKEIKHGHLFSWIRNSDWYLGVTDLSFPKGEAITWTIKDDAGVERRIPIDKNSFVGKAISFDMFRMQTNKLKLPGVHGVTLVTVLAVLRQISQAQLVERDMFQDRIKNGEPLFMHEMLYPVLQGIDSSTLSQIYGSCDLEVGGSDQTFNMLMGRKIMELAKRPEQQAVLSFELLVGTDGKEKMSKSLDNYIGITEAPNEMFGKLMSIPDTAISSYLELCTFTGTAEVGEIKKKLETEKVNPRDIKMDIAEQIVEIYHGRAKAKDARGVFVSTFQDKKVPEKIPEAKITKGTLLVDALINEDILDSKSEFRRLISEGAIRKNGEEKLTDPMMKIEDDLVLKIGKHRFIRIVVQ